MAFEFLQPKSVHKTVGYSHAARVGKKLYISGQVSKDKDDKLVGKGDFEAQAVRVFENLKSIVEEAGSTMDNIVKLTSFLTHSAYIAAYRNIRQRYFKQPDPANTLVIVSSLASEDFLIEVEAIAVLD